MKELEQIGAESAGVPWRTNLLEGGNETPWLAPMELNALGCSITLIPHVDPVPSGRGDRGRSRRPAPGQPDRRRQRVDLTEWEEIVDVPSWAVIEKTDGGRSS